jgi:phytoene dehydrogenase-like protein
MARRKEYDVIVVGGGPGGVTCAAFLANWGLKTLLIEKNERVGGKMITLSKRGFTYQLSAMNLAPLKGHGVEVAFKELGIESELKTIPAKTSVSFYRGRSGKWNKVARVFGQEEDPTALFQQWELDDTELGQALMVLAEMATMPPEKIDLLDDMTFDELLARYEIPAPLYSQFGQIANNMCINLTDLACAGEAVRMFQDATRIGMDGCGYSVGGLGRLYEVLGNTVEAKGGEVLTRTRVESITVSDDRVTGVATKQDEFKAPIVVSNAGIQPTVLKLVGEQHFDRSYVSYVKDLVPGMGFIGGRYFLSRPVLQDNLYSVYSDTAWLNLERYLKIKEGQQPRDVVIFATVTSNFDPTAAPPGKQMLLMGSLCSPYPDEKEMKAVTSAAEQTMFEIFPELESAIEDREYLGPHDVSSISRDHVLPNQGGEAEGLARVPGQSGSRKPSAKSPLRGMFYTGGDTAGGTGVGSNEAVHSGMNVARTVFRYFKMRQV